MNPDQLQSLIEDPDRVDTGTWGAALGELRASPASRAELVRHLALNERLSRLLDPARADIVARVRYRCAHAPPSRRFVNRVMSQTRKRGPGQGSRPWTGRVAAVLAICAVAIGATWMLMHEPESVRATRARIVIVHGEVSLVHDGRSTPAVSGQVVATDDAVSVAGTGSVVLGFGDGTAFSLRGDAAGLQLGQEQGAKRAILRQGELTAEVAAQPAGRPLVITTGLARVEVVGTAFSLRAGTASTRLAVRDGKVRFTATADGRSGEVTAGQQALATAAGMSIGAGAGLPPDPRADATRWPHGIPADPGFFPIAVWFQDPALAERYRQIGVNLYVALPDPATDEAISAIAAAGMRLVCDQNAVALRHRDEPTIIGWLNNAPLAAPASQTVPDCDPAEVEAGYQARRARDPSRPILLYLFPEIGVSWGFYPGASPGVVRSDTDYVRYIASGDILGLEVFPLNRPGPGPGQGVAKLPAAIDQLAVRSDRGKPIWSWIECTRIKPGIGVKPTPEQVRAEVWLSLIHGARGIGYFCHSWVPSSDANALLNDAPMRDAVGAINRQVTGLAPVLNSREEVEAALAVSSNPAVGIDLMTRSHGGVTYIFATAREPGETSGTFSVPAGSAVEVLGEGRSLVIRDGMFSDRFSSQAVHLYRILP